MANGDRYRRERGLPQFQRADTSGFFRAASEAGRQAAAAGEAAGALQMRARVLENVGQQAYEIGADLARQHGQSREVEPMRDGEGNMVPLVQRLTLNISDRLYHQRQREAWQVQAFNAYKERSEAEAKKHRLDPQAYSDAMADVKQELMARAPGALSGTFEAQLDDFALGVRSGIDSLVTRTEQRAADLGIEQNLSREQTSFLTSGTREADLRLFIGGKPNMDLYGDLIATRETIPLLSSGEQPDARYTPRHEVWNDDLARLGLQVWFSNHANQVRQIDSQDPLAASSKLLNYRRMIEEDRVRVPGWSDDFENNPSSKVFSDLSAESQERLRGQMDRLSERISAESRLRNNIAHDNFQKSQIDKVRNLSKAYPSEIQNQGLRRHIDSRTRLHPSLSRSFVRSVIWNESGNNPFARSPTGVVGMMQVTTATGQEMADRLGRSYNPNREDPYASTTYGIEYLASLMEDSQGWCPHCNQAQREVLVAAAYNRGPGMIEQVMQQGADMSNPRSWLSVLGSLKNGQEGVTFAKRVMASKSAINGGMGIALEGVEAEAAQRFSNPLDYMRAMRQFHSNWTQANSWRAYNQGLVYQPPAFDSDLARTFVETEWAARFDPSAPNPVQAASIAAQSIVKMVQQDTPFGHAVQIETLNKANRLMSPGGETATSRRLRHVMTQQGGSVHTREDANLAARSLTGGHDPRPLDTFRQHVAQGRPVVGERIARHTFNGQKANTRYDAELMTLAETGMRTLGRDGFEQNEIGPFLSTMDAFYGVLATPGQAEVIKSENYGEAIRGIHQARQDLARLMPGGENIVTAMDYALRNRAKLERGDTDTYTVLRAILDGQEIKQYWKDQSAEFQMELAGAITESIEDGVREARGNFVSDLLPSLANVSSRTDDILMQEGVMQMAYLNADTASSGLARATVAAFSKGRLGYSQYGYDVNVTSNEGYDPTGVALIENPLENQIHPYSALLPDHYEAMTQGQWLPDVQIETGQRDADGNPILETVPMVRGTLQGAAQAAFEDRRWEVDAAKEMEDGIMKFFPIKAVVSPGQRRAVLVQSMRFVRVDGANEGRWEPGVIFSTAEMEDIAATPAFNQAHAAATLMLDPLVDVMAIAAKIGPAYMRQWEEFGLGPFFSQEQFPARLQPGAPQ